MSDYSDIVVRKPWGYEYLMYQSDAIAIWFLHIRCEAQTSLHCHPGKKTGFILLSGESEVSFLNDSMRMRAVGKLMIREGLFHSTKAVSPRGINVIEVESPPDKGNLVRLEDQYGRKEQPYEGKDATVPMHEDCIRLALPENGAERSYSVDGCRLVIETIRDADVLHKRDADEIILVIGGGLISKTDEYILSPGDVVTIGTFNRLAGTFRASPEIHLMTVLKEATTQVS